MRRKVQKYLSAPRRRLSSIALATITVCIAAIGLLTPQTLSAQARATSARGKGAIVKMDQATFHQFLRSAGYRTRGAGKIGRDKAESSDPSIRAFPHFSSSFTVNGVTYPFTMLGYPPKSGRQASFRSVIIPLRMNFLGFGPNGDVNVTFDPAAAVNNVVHSPMYQNAQFVNGYGQFGEMMQRAAFWNQMDEDREWSVRMAPPRILPTIDVEVFPDTADPMFPLIQIGNDFVGNALIDYIDGVAQSIIQAKGFAADELPVFVTGNAIAQALGYHSAFSVTNPNNSVSLNTYIYTSWLDPALVPSLLADVSTFNHENLEWMNDPFINNVVPVWKYPPDNDPRTVCSGNPFLEVGDPQGNGPTFDDYPTIVVPIDGVNYHLQQLVLYQWFTDEVPSSAQNGWYTYPNPSSLTVPAVYCK
jgi:hypothetical protein